MKLVVFAGGVGTRLWPLSRKNSPKQFEKLFGDRSTLQQTVDRLLPDFDPEDIFIATGEQYAETVHKQLDMLPKENFFFEPAMRDVGPALGMVAMLLEKRFPGEPVAILWSDHMVKDEALFRSALKLAGSKVRSQEADFIFITQKPRFANQNMGWIQVGRRVGETDGIDIFDFERLRYRPTLEEAETFFKDSSFVWNLGYFVTMPSYLTTLFSQYTPTMYESLKRIQDADGTDQFGSVLSEVYPKLEKISFDDAILTKLHPDKVLVLSADLQWSDIGAWESLKEALADEEHENVVKGTVMVEDSRDSLVYNDTPKLVVGIDLDGFLVINTEDVILICPKASVPKIKQFVEKLSGTEHERLT